MWYLNSRLILLQREAVTMLNGITPWNVQEFEKKLRGQKDRREIRPFSVLKRKTLRFWDGIDPQPHAENKKTFVIGPSCLVLALFLALWPRRIMSPERNSFVFNTGWNAQSTKHMNPNVTHCSHNLTATLCCYLLLLYNVSDRVKLHFKEVAQRSILKRIFTLYAPCIILQYVYKPTRCTKFLWLDFIFH